MQRECLTTMSLPGKRNKQAASQQCSGFSTVVQSSIAQRISA